MVANFVVGTDGVPSLRNVADITPAGGGKFFEAHGFSPDGKKAIFTSDMGTPGPVSMDIWTMDLASRALTNMTSSPHWDEHATYSPAGQRISFMSSEPYLWSFLKTELMQMKADGTGKRQLTHFNVPGYVESTAVQSMPTRANWDSTGTRLAVTQQMANTYPAAQMWTITFAGVCGN
jgi:Tol biopolymer transport system component